MRPVLDERSDAPQSGATSCHCGLQIHELQEFMGKVPSVNPVLLPSDAFLMVWLIRSQAVYCIYAGQLKYLGDLFCGTGYVLSFTPDFICSLHSDIGILHQSGLFNFYQADPLAISVENIAEMDQLLHGLVKEYFDSTKLRIEMLRSLLKVLIIKLSRRIGVDCLPEINMHGDIWVFKAFQDMVSRNFMRMKKVSDYAEALGIAPNYLNIKVKRVSGFTARHHIQQRILQEAKRQANWEGMSLKQIAYKLGFEDLSHFSKFFKKTAGINFTEFKRVSPVWRPAFSPGDNVH